MRFSALALAAGILLAGPAAAQHAQDAAKKPPAKPTHVVARSDQLVTARAPNGDTRSYNCRKPANAKRKVCKR